MFVRNLLLSSLFICSIANAAPVRGEQVVTEVTAEPTNGGFNPAYTGVRLKGFVKLGSNACEAGRYQVQIEKATKQGRYVLVAKAKTVDSDRICPLFVDLNHKGVAFDQSIILKSSTSLDKVFVANVDTKGNYVSLSSLLNANEGEGEEGGKCDERVICTLEFNPTTCTDAAGNSFSGGNKCSAIANAKKAACLRGETLDVSELTCVSGAAL